MADKIEKAATKKYKMTSADLAKADQLTKANADFQVRCSTIMPRPMSAQAPSSATQWRTRPLRRRKQRRRRPRRVASARRAARRTNARHAQVGVLRASCGSRLRIASAAGNFFPSPFRQSWRADAFRGRDLCCCKVATRRFRMVENVATLCFVGGWLRMDGPRRHSWPARCH